MQPGKGRLDTHCVPKSEQHSTAAGASGARLNELLTREVTKLASCVRLYPHCTALLIHSLPAF